MGKRLDALLRRSFKASKFRATVAMAVSRLAVLRNQRRARCTIARSDVVELLKNNSHERALLRVDQVLKEQNVVDVFDLVEEHCHLLTERAHLLEKEKVCPEELKEASSTLIYVASRCGDFPELQQIRSIFASRFGTEFVARAVELRNNCSVNPKIIRKLSTRMPSLEDKMKVLEEIASENNINLRVEVQSEYVSSLGENPVFEITRQEDNNDVPPHSSNLILGARRTYRDVADAAQAAFESAAYAAAAAHVAVELSRSGPHTPKRTQLKTLEAHNPTEDEAIEPDNIHLDGGGVLLTPQKHGANEFRS